MKIILLSAAMLLSAPWVLAQSSTPAVTLWTEAQYAAITYEWKNDAGELKVSKLTDEATHPNQIKALLEKVYYDPSIPGTKTIPVDEVGGTADIPYGYVHYVEGVNPGSTIAGGEKVFNRKWFSNWKTDYLVQEGVRFNDMQVKPGADEKYRCDVNGLTVLLVEVKDDFVRPNQNYNNPDYQDVIEEAAAAFKRVKLLPNGVRVGEGTDSARSVFSYQGDLNRFYFISKGKPSH